MNLTPKILTALFIVACCPVSFSCITQAKFEFEDIKLAKSVFVGEVANYEVVKPEGKMDLSAYAVITFVIDIFLTEELAHKELKAYWHNTTFGVPPTLPRERFLVALTSLEQPPLRGPSATLFKSKRPDLMSILQAPCADPFLLEPSKWNIDKARKLLKD